MEGGGVGDVEVEFAVQLPVVLFLNQVVEADVLELAQRADLRTRDHVTGRVNDGVGVGDAAVGARQVQARVAEGGPAALRVLGEGADREVALDRRQFRTMAIAAAQQQARAVIGETVGQAGVIVAVRPVDIGVAALQLEPVEILAGDEVDHAADGVGAVGGGRAVLEDFHPANGRLGQEVGVDEDRTRRGRHPAAVEQHQGPLGAQAAEVGAADARGLAGAELVGFTHRALHGRDRLDQVHRRGRPLLLEFVGADDVHRQGGVLRRTGDEGAGDDHFFHHGGRVGARSLGRSGTGRKSRGDGEDRSGHQIMRASHAFPRFA